jgi:hypothetical protein
MVKIIALPVDNNVFRWLVSPRTQNLKIAVFDPAGELSGLPRAALAPGCLLSTACQAAEKL